MTNPFTKSYERNTTFSCAAIKRSIWEQYLGYLIQVFNLHLNFKNLKTVIIIINLLLKCLKNVQWRTQDKAVLQ